MAFLIWRTVTKATRGREPVSFVVSGEGINIGGTLIQRARLTCIRIDNDVTHEEMQIPISNDPVLVVPDVLPGALLIHRGNPTNTTSH
jgi:hypothetical protein